MKRVPWPARAGTGDYMDATSASAGRRRHPRHRAETIRIGRPTRWAGRARRLLGAIADKHNLELTVSQPVGRCDGWRFMTLDTDGKIRTGLFQLTERDGLVSPRPATPSARTGSDADSDRHGIVTPDGRVDESQPPLAVAIDYLYPLPDWP